MSKISAVYQIVNTVTGDSYVGSSKNVNKRWADHKCPSMWKQCPNNPMYQDMQKYGLDKFRFQILAPVMEEYLKDVEQEFIEILKPTYNNANAKGLNVDRAKEYNKEYCQSEKHKEAQRGWNRKYINQFCSYNGETLTLNALYLRFRRAGIEHAKSEARKYLIKGE